ncbi:MAG: hypothetical protein HPY81_02535 [Firmicutes bacterium]|nr:hypothetical protein [Bacillota bacterium]
MQDQFEQFWAQDLKEKRKVISGARHRASRLGRVGRMRLPADCMDRKQRKEYMKPGEVKVYNMYDNVIPKEEFGSLPVEKQRELLLKWRDDPRIGVKGIIESWNVSRGTYYKKTKELGLSFSKMREKRTATKTKEQAQELSSNTVHIIEEKLINRFALQLEGEYEGRCLTDRLEKLGLILNSEAKYMISIQIIEL